MTWQGPLLDRQVHLVRLVALSPGPPVRWVRWLARWLAELRLALALAVLLATLLSDSAAHSLVVLKQPPEQPVRWLVVRVHLVR